MQGVNKAGEVVGALLDAAEGILSRSYSRSLHNASGRHAVCRCHVDLLLILSHTVTASVRL